MTLAPTIPAETSISFWYMDTCGFHSTKPVQMLNPTGNSLIAQPIAVIIMIPTPRKPDIPYPYYYDLPITQHCPTLLNFISLIRILGSMQKKPSEPPAYEIQRSYAFDPSAEGQANWLSRLYFVWTHQIMRRGAKKPLEMNDLFDLKPIEEPQYSHEKFTQIYNSLDPNTKSKTFTVLRIFLTWTFVLIAVYAIFANLLQFAGPLMINEILIFLQNPSIPSHMGFVWASVLVVSYLVRSIVLQHAFHLVNEVSVKTMNSLIARIYFKILKLSSASRKYLETGAIMNYINVDVQAVNMFIQMSSFIFTTPVMVIVAIVLIVREIGWIGVSAPIIMFIGVYFQQKLMKVAFAMRKDQLYWTDKRSKCVTEYFGGIRIIKYYGWEDIVAEKIENIRSEEIKLIFRALMIRTYIEVLMNMMPIVASILCFGMYVKFYGDSLTPAKVYTVLTLFNLMANPMRMLVMSLIQFANAKASMARIEHFLQYFDIKDEGINTEDTELQVGQIRIKDGKFRWETAQAKLHYEQGKKLMSKTPMEKKKLEESQKSLKVEKKKKKKKFKQQKTNKEEQDGTGRLSKASLYTENTIKQPLLKKQQQQRLEEVEEQKFEQIAQKKEGAQKVQAQGGSGSKSSTPEQIKSEESKEQQKNQQKVQADQKPKKKPIVLVQQKPQNQQTENQSSDQKEQSQGLSLQIDDLTIKQTELVGVIGRVGAGKSTLLSAILNEVDKVSGTVSRRGKVAYIPQISWLRSATIRQNIIFQSQYKEEWYKHVLKVCQLQSDLEVLGGGDLTQVGEKGVNLSGGQKQRISIARALYADADIYLIDDCLSALDSYVAKKIFTNVITGALKTKTVVFVTHAIHFVNQCDTIIVMADGKIHERGTYDDLMNTQTSLFRSLESQYRQEEESQEEQKKEEERKKSERKQSEVVIQKGKGPKKEEKIQALVKVQERTRGKVPWAVYYRFFTGAGGMLTFLMFFFIILGQAARIASDWWVGSWSSDAFHLSQSTYIWIYASVSVFVGLLILMKGYFFAKFINRSSQTLQRQLIQTLLKSPLTWFDVTPTGRILSRTTKDQDDLDTSLAFNVQMTVQNLLMMFSSIILAGVITPIYFAFAAVALIIYYFVITFYMSTSVELKRLEANTRSPLISHIQQTINGMYVIRAFNKSQSFINKFFRRQKDYIVAFTNQNAASRWISILTDLFAVAVIGGAAYLGVIQRGKSSANLIGLSLSWVLQISSVLSFTLKLMADTESNMNAVIRLLDYIDHNPSERDFKQPKAPKKWPKAGKYKMNNLTYRYRPELEDVIHGITFDVAAKAKIGVVGRTGSGKSTLTLGLLRILELAADPDGQIGQINLDGVDIAKIGLHELRHKVTIIPQDPVLFSGTLKDNIDPFNIYSDQQIAMCLKKVDLWDQIKPNTDELTEVTQRVYGIVDDAGGNYSVGQRQLVCMARALIRKPKVLLMDEATASIDQKTDTLLQKMIRKQFKDTTVITIAHRLNTIIHYDKILVLDYGTVKEYSTPRDLIMNENSFLGNLVKETGKQYQERMITLLNNPSPIE